MYRGVLAALLCLLIGFPGFSTAQTPTPIPDGPRLQAVFRTLKDSQSVRLATDIGRREGRLRQRSLTELVLSPEPLRISATTIDTLWIRGTSIKRGAVLGRVIGMLAGIGVGLIWAETGDDAETYGATAIAGGGGAVGGTLLGALIGSALPKWHRRYP